MWAIAVHNTISHTGTYGTLYRKSLPYTPYATSMAMLSTYLPTLIHDIHWKRLLYTLQLLYAVQ